MILINQPSGILSIDYNQTYGTLRSLEANKTTPLNFVTDIKKLCCEEKNVATFVSEFLRRNFTFQSRGLNQPDLMVEVFEFLMTDKTNFRGLEASPIKVYDYLYSIMCKVSFKNNTFKALGTAFTLWVWLGVLLSLLTVSFQQTFFNFSSFSIKRFGNRCFENLIILVGDSIRKETSLILAFWLLASLILSNSYKGLVFASLTKNEPIYYRTFAQIESDSSLKPFVINHAWRHIIDENIDSQLLKRLAKRFVQTSHIVEKYNLAIIRVITDDIPFIIHDTYNDRWRKMFYPLPLKMGDEKFYWTLSTKFPIYQTSKFKKEIYFSISVFYETGLYQHHTVVKERQEKHQVDKLIRGTMSKFHLLEKDEFIVLVLESLKAIFELFIVSLLICVIFLLFEFIKLKCKCF